MGDMNTACPDLACPMKLTAVPDGPCPKCFAPTAGRDEINSNRIIRQLEHVGHNEKSTVSDEEVGAALGIYYIKGGHHSAALKQLMRSILEQFLKDKV